MLNKDSDISVVGAGAIGCVTASFLQQSGWNLEVVCKHQEIVDRAVNEGFHITGVKGEHVVRLNAVKNISDMSGKKDLLLLATRAADCLTAAYELIAFLKPSSIVVSLQNGICEDALGEILGRKRVMGCVVAWAANHFGPGTVRVTLNGEFVIGNIDQKPDDNLSLVQRMLNTVAPTRISENIIGELYSKLIINSCITSLGVIVGEDLGTMMANKKVRRLFLILLREAMAVADALMIKVAPVLGGKLDYYRFLSGRGVVSELKRHAVMRAMGLKYSGVRSSTLRFVEQGRKTEVDYLNGYIVEKGKLNGIDTPFNAAVVDMIKEIEEGKRKISRDNLDDPRLNDI